MLGGGQDAMAVTTTSSRQGKFEVQFFHLAFEEEIGRVKGHFGPINTLAFHPLGKGYASGGEGKRTKLFVFNIFLKMDSFDCINSMIVIIALSILKKGSDTFVNERSDVIWPRLKSKFIKHLITTYSHK